MSMFNDISCDRKGNKEECLANARVVKVLAKKFGIGQWSFIGPGSEKKWYSAEEKSPQGAWDHIADEMLLEFAESGCPIFRATTPLSRGKLKSKGHGKLSMAREMGSPRQVDNRRRRTREGPEPACVQTPLSVGVARVSGRHVVQGRQCSPAPAQASRVSVAVRGAPRGTGKAGENGQHSGEVGGSSAWTRPSAPDCGDTLKALAGDQRPI